MMEAGFFPEKKYSQNFLVDDDAVMRLVESASLSKKDRVLEIGAGTGFVTEKLVETGAFIHAVELRPELCSYLSRKFEGVKNVEVIHKDILQLTNLSLDFNKVVASPPYAISDDIMYLIFEHGFEHASLVWQFEFADKILAPPGSSEYHPLSIIAQYQYDGNILQKISPKSFFPVPNHFSAILTLHQKKKNRTIPNYPIFVKWLRTLFRFKNKTLVSVAKQLDKNPVPGIPRSVLEKAIHELGLEHEKVFLLEPEDFVELYRECVKE